MNTSRDPFAVLQSLAAAQPVDHERLARARAAVERTRTGEVQESIERRTRMARRSRRVLAVAGLSMAAAVGAIVLPMTDSSRLETTTPPVAQFLGVIPAAAVGMGCSNEDFPVPGLSDPEQVVPRDQWDSLPPVRQILHLVGDRTPQMARVTSGPAVCDAIPVAVLHDEAAQRGIVVYRDVTEPFRGAPELGETTVRGYAAQVLSPPAGHHYMSWTDDDGMRWFAEAAGVSVEELAEALTVSLDDDGLAAVPDGFSAVPVPAHDPDGTLYRWSVQYEEGGYVYLEVTSLPRTPVETMAARTFDQQYTTVGGARAVYMPQGQGGASIRWTTDEASYRLVVAGADLPELRNVAENLEHITPDDARVPPPAQP